MGILRVTSPLGLGFKSYPELLEVLVGMKDKLEELPKLKNEIDYMRRELDWIKITIDIINSLVEAIYEHQSSCKHLPIGISNYGGQP